MTSPEPNILIECPAPGHYLVRGHNPSTVVTPDGRLVPPKETYVAPELPSSVLIAILKMRGLVVLARPEPVKKKMARREISSAPRPGEEGGE